MIPAGSSCRARSRYIASAVCAGHCGFDICRHIDRCGLGHGFDHGIYPHCTLGRGIHFCLRRTSSDSLLESIDPDPAIASLGRSCSSARALEPCAVLRVRRNRGDLEEPHCIVDIPDCPCIPLELSRSLAIAFDRAYDRTDMIAGSEQGFVATAGDIDCRPSSCP